MNLVITHLSPTHKQVHDIDGELTIDIFNYALGYDKPRFPVPAMCIYARYDCLVNALIEHREREWTID